jgi:hypothetical protein
MSSSVPKTVSQLCLNHDAWVVGSAANEETDISLVRDFDILVPFHSWHPASVLIPEDAKVNPFGGWKFELDGIEYDVWPGDLGWFMLHSTTRCAWNPSRNIRMVKGS